MEGRSGVHIVVGGRCVGRCGRKDESERGRYKAGRGEAGRVLIFGRVVV